MQRILYKKRYLWMMTAGLLHVIMITALLMGYTTVGTPHYKGTWIWESAAITNETESILNFSEQNEVTHIYLQIDPDHLAPKDYALFIKEASKRRIQVEALGGRPSWALEENQHQLQKFVDWVVGYNVNVNEDERFSGIHMDIEPYLLPEWESKTSHIVDQWLANLEFTVSHAHFKASDLKFSVDLPFWVKKIEVPGYEDYDVGTWMLKRFDKVVIMDYRDKAEGSNGIIANALELVKEAAALKKMLIIGVEMSPSREGSKTTFYEEGYEIMERELDITRRQLRNYSGFQGVAIHGFSHWMNSKGE